MSSRERELAWVIEKIKASESLIERAEAFYAEHADNWSSGVASYFQDILERKRDQVYYEQHRAERLGWLIAMGREEDRLDI